MSYYSSTFGQAGAPARGGFFEECIRPFTQAYHDLVCGILDGELDEPRMQELETIQRKGTDAEKVVLTLVLAKCAPEDFPCKQRALEAVDDTIGNYYRMRLQAQDGNIPDCYYYDDFVEGILQFMSGDDCLLSHTKDVVERWEAVEAESGHRTSSLN